MFAGQLGPVAAGRRARDRDDGARRGPTARHRLRDPFALQRVDQAGRVAHEQDAPTRGHGPDHAHLEPAAEASHLASRTVQESAVIQVIDERMKVSRHGRSRAPVVPRADADAEVGRLRAGEQPAVARQRPAAFAFPEHDGREVDVVVEIRPHGEAPQHAAAIHQSRDVADAGRCTVGSDHEVGADAPAAFELESLELVRPGEQRRMGMTSDPRRAGIGGRGGQDMIEHGPANGQGIAGIGETREAREADRPGRSDDPHLAYRRCAGQRHAQVMEDLDPPRPDQVAAGLVPREPGLVDEGHLDPGAGQLDGGHTAGRPGSDHGDVVVVVHPRSYSTRRGGDAYAPCRGSEP